MKFKSKLKIIIKNNILILFLIKGLRELDFGSKTGSEISFEVGAEFTSSPPFIIVESAPEEPSVLPDTSSEEEVLFEAALVPSDGELAPSVILDLVNEHVHEQLSPSSGFPLLVEGKVQRSSVSPDNDDSETASPPAQTAAFFSLNGKRAPLESFPVGKSLDLNCLSDCDDGEEEEDAFHFEMSFNFPRVIYSVG